MRVNKADKNCILKIVTLIGILLWVPFLIECKYAFPYADDFSNAVDVGTYLNTCGNGLTAAFRMTREIYATWQGTYILFFLYWILAITNCSIVSTRIFYLLIVVLSLAILYLIAKMIASFAGVRENVLWNRVIYILLILVGISVTSPSENFYWLTGAFVYTIPFDFCLLALYLDLKYYESYKKRYLVFATICSVIASGGVLFVVALVNQLLLLTFLVKWKQKRNLICIIPFIGALLGGLVNVLAPGNYVRSDMISSSKPSIIVAFIDTLHTIAYRVECLLEGSPIICILLCLSIAVWIADIEFKDKKWHPMVIAIIGMAIICISVFPIAFGYRDSVSIDRATFLINILLTTYLYILTFSVNIWIKSRIVIENSNEFKVVLGLMSIFFVLSSTMTISLKEMIIPQMVIEQLEGDATLYAKSQEYIISTIEESTEDDLIIEAVIHKSKIFDGVGFTDDPGNWVNRELAEYWNKSSITVIELSD